MARFSPLSFIISGSLPALGGRVEWLAQRLCWRPSLARSFVYVGQVPWFAHRTCLSVSLARLGTLMVTFSGSLPSGGDSVDWLVLHICWSHGLTRSAFVLVGGGGSLSVLWWSCGVARYRLSVSPVLWLALLVCWLSCVARYQLL